jgi:ADP-heptose:LPS heptosyltransferase/predicted SAM-dependent methyltransferase
VTWTAETSQGRESDKIAAFVVPYTRGRGLDVGCGMAKCWPHMIGIDSGHHFGRGAADIIAAADDLSIFADDGLDFVFSSHLLEHIEDTRKALAEWWRVIRPGGHLCLYLPHKDLYPNIGEPGANVDHKHDFLPQDIIDHMVGLVEDWADGWTLVENETRAGTNEYSVFLVFRKNAEKRVCRYEVWDRNPEGKQRALVIRFGAIGDQIMAASVIPLLKEQGFHVTYMTTPDAQQVLLHNPNIDEWLIQDKDQVPNLQLGAYIETLGSRYDRIVNLCESIEGSLLVLPGRPSHSWPAEARRKALGTVNYLERTHDLAGVPYRFAARFHPTKEERQEALAFKSSLGGPVVMWAINGSSVHKVYPFTNVVVDRLLRRTDARVILSAGPGEGEELQAAIIQTLDRQADLDLSRVIGIAGEWDIRRALTFAEYADVVVGPETGLVNAAGMLATPTVVMLSHSSRENLTKHWRNTIVLEPPLLTTPCFSCHRLHYGWDHCPKVEETGGALCASNIAPERVFDAIRRSLASAEKIARRAEAAD